MNRWFAVTLLSTFAIAQAPSPSPSEPASSPRPNSEGSLPPMPPGKSTVIGGEIRDFDPIRDQFTLKVFGGTSLKVLFDERTQVFRNGAKIRVLDLHKEEHASIETTLDGTKIFALRIHLMSELPEGEWQGQVSDYNPHTGDLILKAALSKDPITIRIPAGTPVARVGDNVFTAKQGGTSDLLPGSLVDVRFRAATGGHGVATKIDIIAVPGALFEFSGKLSFLDAHAGRFVLIDARNDESRQISYDPSHLLIGAELHEGSDVKVTTIFDGSRYLARGITIE